MAVVRPFVALRPAPALAARVAAPPYDVVDDARARALTRKNPDSFLHVSRSEVDLEPGVDPHDARVYARGRRTLDAFVRRGTLVREPIPGLWVYRQHLGTTTQTGVVGCVSVDEYESGAVATHELTRPDKEDDRVRHLDALDAHDEPVFLLHRPDRAVTELVAGVTATPPALDLVTDDDVAHTVWAVPSGHTVDALVAAFAAVPRLYVADGHHRSAAAARLRALRRAAHPAHTGDEPYDRFLAVVFPADQLHVLAYHRAVIDLGRPLPALLAALAERVDVTRGEGPVQPAEPGLLGLYAAGRWYALRVRPGTVDDADPVARLAVSVLQDHVLGPLLGVDDPRTDPRLRFVGGVDAVARLVELVDDGVAAAAFTLPPTTTTDLVEVADRGLLMPPKSTWFEPKLRSGLFVHPLRQNQAS